MGHQQALKCAIPTSMLYEQNMELVLPDHAIDLNLRVTDWTFLKFLKIMQSQGSTCS